MIEVLLYEPVEGKNKIIGYADVKVKFDKFTLILRKIAHLKSDTKEWFAQSTFQRLGPDGMPIYLRHAEIEIASQNGEMMQRISSAVKAYIEKMPKDAMGKNTYQKVQPLFEEKKLIDDLPF